MARKWFGNSDHKTSPSYFSTGGHEYHDAEFGKAVVMLEELASRAHVDLLYLDDERSNKVVAYRFKSDASYDRYERQLAWITGGLGRGVWRPFEDKYQFDTFLRGEDGPAETADKWCGTKIADDTWPEREKNAQAWRLQKAANEKHALAANCQVRA